MPNGISHYYQLGQSISVQGLYFSFYQLSSRTFCKQTVKTLIRSRVLRRLIWVCTLCLCPTKKALGLAYRGAT